MVERSTLPSEELVEWHAVYDVTSDAASLV
jgi:hypothetical protein